MKVLKVIVDEMPEGCSKCGLMGAWSCTIRDKYFRPEYHLTRPDWCPLEVETDEPKYKLARGVLNWKEGDESAVDAIRRLRDSEDTFNLLPEAPKEVKHE